MTRTIILVLLLLVTYMGRAQLSGRAYVDSLVKQVPIATSDTEKTRLLDTIAYLYNTINPDSGIYYADLGLKIATSLNWKRGIAKAYNSFGANFIAKSENVRALDYYYKAMALFEELNDNRSLESTYGNIGNVYVAQNKYGRKSYYDSMALHYDSLALSICKKYNYTAEIVRHLGNMGVIFDDEKKYPEALSYYNSAMKIAEQNNLKSDIAKNLGNIAGVYYSADSLLQAIAFGKKALVIYEEIGDKHGLAANLANMGAFYDTLATKIGSQNPSMREKYLNDAVQYLNRSTMVSKEIGFADCLNQCYKMLSDAYEQLGNSKEAFRCYKLFTELNDSLSRTSSNLKFADLETKRELDLKQKNIELQKNQLEIEQLTKENRRKTSFIYLAGIAGLLIVIAVVVRKFMNSVKSNRQLAIERKKHIERIKAQKSVLQDIAYIQSHEVRGPLSTIMGLVDLFNYEDPSDPNNLELLEGIATVTKRLDKVVTDVVNRENKLNNEEKDADEELPA